MIEIKFSKQIRKKHESDLRRYQREIIAEREKKQKDEVGRQSTLSSILKDILVK